jgi:hypothetical protein
MSQPTSGCNTWVDDLVSLRDSLRHEIRQPADPQVPRYGHFAPVPPESHLTGVSEDQMDVDEYHPNDLVPDHRGGATHSLHAGQQAETCELFPGAARVYYTGSTFMDNFKADQFNEHRINNPYYPFASREEWGLALWLLRVGLSMKAIDDFLKLPMVRRYAFDFCRLVLIHMER